MVSMPTTEYGPWRGLRSPRKDSSRMRGRSLPSLAKGLPRKALGPDSTPSLDDGAALTFLVPARVSSSPARGQGRWVFPLGVQR